MQRKLAVLCIEKAKLCVCISHILTTQYQVNNPKRGRTDSSGNALHTMTLAAKKSPDSWQIKSCNDELTAWFEALPGEAKYSSGRDSYVLHQALLHMFYYTVVGALHRPLFIANGALPHSQREPDLQPVHEQRFDLLLPRLPRSFASYTRATLLASCLARV